jgi:transcriptional repressor NF-X1
MESRVECIICFDKVNRPQSTWSCKQCWRILHLDCVKKWRGSIINNTNPGVSEDNERICWRCPACNVQLTEKPRYTCFCKKQRDPKNNPYVTPHSCGAVCGKKLGAHGCDHKCTELCHPGPCPPCQQLSNLKTCPCGGTKYRIKCGEPDPVKTCDKICGKVLACGDVTHVCVRKCHKGKCPPCISQAVQECYCGRVKETRRCGSGVKKERSRNSRVSASLLSMLPLDSGKLTLSVVDSSSGCIVQQHFDAALYSTPCDESVMDLLDQDIATEKMEKPRAPCGISSGHGHFGCNFQCSAVLDCGRHFCTKPCHGGNCSPCMLTPHKVSTCPCGGVGLNDLIPIPRKSCLDPIPTCGNVCKKFLNCGRHSCTLLCHEGPCKPCTQQVIKTCRCALESREVPCISTEATENTILCESVCNARLSCGKHRCTTVCCLLREPGLIDVEGVHTCRTNCTKGLNCGNHTCYKTCHTGPCPPCDVTVRVDKTCDCGATRLRAPFICGKKLPECNRMCNKARSCGHPHSAYHLCHPGDDCGPCLYKMNKPCVGGHQLLLNIPCTLKDAKCGSKCSKPLPCGSHSCTRLCHGGPCLNEGVSCNQVCGKKRRCGHSCESKCHSIDNACEELPCDKYLCSTAITVSCSCGRRKETMDCTAYEEFRIRWGLDGGDSTQGKGLECDEECKLNERNRLLAEAFGISPKVPDGGYSNVLISWAKFNLEFVKDTEEKFAKLLDGSEKSIALKNVNRAHRSMVTEMGEFYGFEVIHYDRGSYSEIRKTVTSHKPDMKLCEAVQTGGVGKDDGRMHPEEPLPGTLGIPTIHLFGYTSSVRVDNLHDEIERFCRREHYHLKQIDSSNTILVFRNEERARKVLEALNSPVAPTLPFSARWWGGDPGAALKP